MPTRALIVAIEKYPLATDLATQLPGTSDAATAFRQWLLDWKKIKDAADIFACAGPEIAWRTAGTTRPEIINEIKRLHQAGKDGTEELFVYFSGHGLSYPRDEAVVIDILVASDYVDLASSGGACLKMEEVLQKLAVGLGPRQHYHFIDACRTIVPWNSIEPLGMGVVFKPSELGRASRATLFSTSQGLAARTASGFAQHLVEGLNGKGRAKGWVQDKLYVRFDLVCDYVAQQTHQPVEPETRGPGDRLILNLDPVPLKACTIRVEDTGPGDAFTLLVKLRDALAERRDFIGPTYVVQLRPEDYTIELSQLGDPLERVQPPLPGLVDLYEPNVVVFRKSPGGLEAAPGPVAGTGTLEILGAPNAEIRLAGIATPQRITTPLEEAQMDLPAGDYLVELAEGKQVVSQKRVTVTPGRMSRVDLLEAKPDPLREAIRQLVDPQGTRVIQFSETLGGPTGDRDLGLWLAWLGASRIMGREGEFSKLDNIPLPYRFKDVPADSAPLYVLTGFPKMPQPPAVRAGKPPGWATMETVATVPGLFEYFAQGEPGPRLVSFQRPSRPPVTLSTYGLPNRATLLILTPGDRHGDLQVYQCLIPIRALIGRLDPNVRARIDLDPLNATRFMIHAQRLFTLELPIEGSLAIWDDLIFGKWFDPVSPLIAVFDLLRRGVMRADLPPGDPLSKYRDRLPEIIDNMRKYFGGLPDIEAIAARAGQPWHPPHSPPLLLDSLAAFADVPRDQFLPLPADRLHYGSPWVMWSNAVPSHFQAVP
jgi:hypothetical protein